MFLNTRTCAATDTHTFSCYFARGGEPTKWTCNGYNARGQLCCSASLILATNPSTQRAASLLSTPQQQLPHTPASSGTAPLVGDYEGEAVSPSRTTVVRDGFIGNRNPNFNVLDEESHNSSQYGFPTLEDRHGYRSSSSNLSVKVHQHEKSLPRSVGFGTTGALGRLGYDGNSRNLESAVMRQATAVEVEEVCAAAATAAPSNSSKHPRKRMLLMLSDDSSEES
jgi:hypothetical protein